MTFYGDDEPVTPAGRFFLQPTVEQVINAIFIVKNPIDLDALKHELERTFVKPCPRFRSLLVRDKNGREYWREVDHTNMDRHVFEVEEDGIGLEFVNDYVASLSVSTPLGLDKPLWEVHVLPLNKCYVMRLHHALGDGISLMSILLSQSRRVDDPRLLPTIPGQTKDAKKPVRRSAVTIAWRLILMVWYTLLFVVDFLLRSVWIKDKITPISGGEGVELWPRKLQVATFDLGDMRIVKNAVGATINDVLLGIIESGFSKYLELRSSELKRPLRISGLALVNTRQQPGLQEMSNMMANRSKARWGNQIGYMVLPVDLERRSSGNGDPLEYVRRAKAMTDKKKLSLEAHFSYAGGALIMALFGPEVATAMNYRIMCNTTFTLSNVVGPLEEISYAGNPVKYLRVTSSSLPHAITMHMVSYNGKADLQILVAKDIVPDSDVLKKCFEDALDDMKNSALIHTTKKED